MIQFHCSGCNTSLKVPDGMAGKGGKCPKCGARIVAPSEDVALDNLTAALSPASTAESPSPGLARTPSATPSRQRGQQRRRTSPIKYRCAVCGEKLESGPSLAGKQDKCPACERLTPVPMQSTLGWAKIPMGARIAGVAIIAAIAIALTMWLALRDTWERDHATEIVRMSEATVSLIRNGKNEEGVHMHDSMLALVRDRTPQAPSLRQAMIDAKEAAESAKRQLQEAENLSKLLGLEKQAKAFIANSDLEGGIEACQQALDLIRSCQTDNPEFANAIRRISRAKTHAAAALEQKRRREEEQRKREEEEREMASIRAKVHGGAWVTKKAGNSETLRGLRIYAVTSSGRNEQFIALLQAVLAGSKKRLTSHEDLAARWLKLTREWSGDKTMAEHYQKQVKIIELRKRLIQSIQDRAANLSRRPATELVDMAVMYKEMPQSPSEEETETWDAICSQQFAGTAHTDVDGKYELELPGGNYYLYARFESTYSRIEWFVPVRVANAGGVKVDFHNENAALIKNKSD